MANNNVFFKIGSNVRIIDKFSMHCGKEGIILGRSADGILLQLQNTRTEIFPEYIQSINLPYNCNEIFQGPVFPEFIQHRRNKRKREKEEKDLMYEARKNNRVRIVNMFNPYYLFVGEIVSKGKYKSKIKIDFHGIVSFNNSDFQREDEPFKSKKKNIEKSDMLFNVGDKIVIKNGPMLGEKGTVIYSFGFYLKRVQLDAGESVDIFTKNLIHDSEDVPDYKQLVKDLSTNRKRIIDEMVEENKNKPSKKPKKDKPSKKIKDMYPEYFEEIYKKYSYDFYLDFETQINNYYKDDFRGTMFYPYEKNEFFKLINKNKKFLNVRQGEYGSTLMSIIIRSSSIAMHDSEKNSQDKIKINLLKMLYLAGADANIKDKQGKTPLRVAFDRKNTEIFEFLIEEMNADPMIPDNKQQSVYSLALKNKMKFITDIIEKVYTYPEMEIN